MSDTWTIYGLIDPRSHELYYVGQTRRILTDRMDEHFYEGNDTLVSLKNQAIIKSGAFPSIVVLDTAHDERTAFHKELSAIHLFAAQGKSLKNREAQQWFQKKYDTAFSRAVKGRSPAKKTKTTRKNLSSKPRKATNKKRRYTPYYKQSAEP